MNQSDTMTLVQQVAPMDYICELKLDNAALIEWCYGEVARAFVLESLMRDLSKAVVNNSTFRVEIKHHGSRTVRLAIFSELSEFHDLGSPTCLWVERWCRDQLVRPLRFGEDRILPSLSLVWLSGVLRARTSIEFGELCEAYDGQSTISVVRYSMRHACKRDMELVCSFADELRKKRLGLSLTPVCRLSGSSDILHYHGELAALTESGTIEDPHLTNVASRRLGLSAVLDQATALIAIQLINANPTIGIQVDVLASSLQSFLFSGELFQSHCKSFSVENLSISVVPDMSSFDIKNFWSIADFTMKGCKFGLVLPQEGAHHGYLSNFKFDFVVIPSPIIVGALQASHLLVSLTTIIALCRLVTPMVIVRGIDSEQTLDLAVECGARFGMGKQVGLPRLALLEDQD